MGSVHRSDQYAPGYSYLSQPYMLIYMISVQSSKVLALNRESMAMCRFPKCHGSLSCDEPTY